MTYFSVEPQETEETVIVMKITKATNDLMIQSYEAEEEAFEGFVGGIEVDKAEFDETYIPAEVDEYVFDIDVEDPDYTARLCKDVFPYIISVDETKIVIPICKWRSDVSWDFSIGVSNDFFYYLADTYGIDNVLTKSDYLEKIKSDEYKKVITEDIGE